MAVKKAQASLLNKKQRATFEKLAKTKGVVGRRAKAVLAVDKRMTHAEAAQKSGLTVGQVRYCLTKLKNQGVAGFALGTAEAGKPKPKTPKSRKDKRDRKKKKSKADKKDKKASKGKKGKKKKKSKK